MVGITIIIALIWDFLFLPALLIKVDQDKPVIDLKATPSAPQTPEKVTHLS